MGKYYKATSGVEAKIVSGYAYVRVTSVSRGMLVSGGYIKRVYKCKTDSKYVGDLLRPINDHGTSEIDAIINDNSNIIRYGTKII